MTQATELRELATLLDVSSGNVGIGLPSGTASNKLVISDGVRTSAAITAGTTALEIARTGGGDVGILINKDTAKWLIGVDNSDGNDGPLRFLYGAYNAAAHPGFGTAADGLNLAYNGNVGIGVKTPSAKLHINSSSLDPTGIGLQNNSRYMGIEVEGGGLRVKDVSAGLVERFRIASSGDVTIGDITAEHKLDVDGSIGTRQVRHSIAPTLNLDFANSKELDSRITFYRDSIATYYDSKGILKYANVNEPRFDHDPATGESKGLLIEEDRTNIFTYTNNPERWPLMSGSSSDPIANNIKSPDGTFNATSLIIDGSDPYFYQNGLTLNGTYTFSYWIKAVGTAIGKQYSTRITNVSTNSNTSGTLPSEWTRYTFTFTTGSTTTAYIGIEAPDSSPADGDEVSIWGAQLELGGFATSLIPSDTRFTSRASVATYYDETGVLRTAPADGARHGYKYDGRNWVETGLILEEAATNRKQNFISSAGALQWSTNQNSEPAANNTVKSPDDSYSTIRQKINSTATAIHSIYDFTTVTAGTQLCFSVYAKAAEYNRIYMYTDGITPTIGGVFYDLSNGTIGGLSVIARDAYGIEDVGNGWYRCWYSGTPTSGTTAYWHIDLAQSDSTRAFAGTVGQGLYLWGPQMEYNGALSSYIYTDTSAVTRAADVATSVAYTRDSDYAYIDIEKYNFWNDRESTIYAETETYIEDYTLGNYNASQYAFSPDSGRVQIRYDNNDGIHAIGYSTPAGVFTNMFTLTPPTATFVTSSKTALSIKQDDYDFSVNGSTISGTASDTSGAFPAPTKLFLGAYREVASPSNSEHLNGVIKKISYYDKKLTNAEMQALTENN
jgi:hypothetical protein